MTSRVAPEQFADERLVQRRPHSGDATTSPIDALIDASKCGKQGYMTCSCWTQCPCGITYEVGGWCRRCGPVATVSCVCSLPAAKRRECGDARNLKTPCRCACHRKEKQ